MTFFRGSRYERVGEVVRTLPDGRTVRYKRVRFIDPPAFTSEHRVGTGERLDRLAWERLGDPERFWKVCDANGALWPPDLLARPGRTIRVPDGEDPR